MDDPVDGAVPEEVGDHLLAVLRAALSNVVRHARAAATTVVVRVQGDVMPRVTDNGIGRGASTRASGLRNLHQRAEILGGAMEVTGPATGGSCLEWRVPLGP